MPARFALLASAALAAALAVTACSASSGGAKTSPTVPAQAQAATTGASAAATASAPSAPSSAASAAAAAPACTGQPTAAQTEGPYFKAGSPARASLLEAGMAGTKLTLSGTVVTKSCKPVANATLEFWQADAQGVYDNSGYRLRGHLSTDAQGGFKLETIVPGEYPGRTEHIHFKVIVPGQPTLTSQFYFPDAARNSSDGIFDPSLLLNLKGAGGTLAASYTIVLDTP